jgi:dTMP kinase
VVEGADGAGKTTAVQGLASWLKNIGVDVRAVREPGGTIYGERIRGVLLAEYIYKPLVPAAEAALFIAARIQLLDEVILPALSRGATVICDRYYMSTLVYQGVLMPGNSVRSMCYAASLAAYWPDLTMVLQVSRAKQKARMRRATDRIESRGDSYADKVRQGYKDMPGLRGCEDRVLMSGNRAAPTVLADIKDVVKAFTNRPVHTRVWPSSFQYVSNVGA